MSLREVKVQASYRMYKTGTILYGVCTSERKRTIYSTFDWNVECLHLVSLKFSWKNAPKNCINFKASV